MATIKKSNRKNAKEYSHFQFIFSMRIQDPKTAKGSENDSIEFQMLNIFLLLSVYMFSVYIMNGTMMQLRQKPEQNIEITRAVLQCCGMQRLLSGMRDKKKTANMQLIVKSLFGALEGKLRMQRLPNTLPKNDKPSTTPKQSMQYQRTLN